MRRWVQLSALPVMTLVAAIPLLPPAKFYFLDDGFLHLFRLFEFDRVLRQGIAFPRWAPDFAYGYGYPVFDFYPPLGYYLGEALHLLGLGIPDALIATFVAISAIALAGAFAMGCELFAAAPNPRRAGALTAVAYVFFPYFLLDLYVRGALAEALAAAVLPWAVWALRRAITQRTMGALALSAIFTGALVLAHNLTTLLVAPILIGLVLLELFRLPPVLRRTAFARVVAATLLGGWLSAIYWLPMLSEVSLVAISHESKSLAAMFTFLTPANVIQLAVPYQYHDEPYPLSLLPMLLAGFALLIVGTIRRSGLARATLIFFGAVALVSTFMLLDVTKPLWLAVPALTAVQFPWRLSVIIGLGTAVLIGGLSDWLSVLRPKLLGLTSIAVAVVSIVLIWNGLAGLQTKRLDQPADPLTVAQMARFEVDTRGLGFGSLGEYLPLTVKALPSQLTPAPTDATPPSIHLTECVSLRCAFTVSAERPIPILLRAFYFPGWQATLDDQPATLYPSTPMGLVTLDAPAGNHRVVFSFGDTLPRQLGAIFSVLGLIVLAMLTGIVFRRRENEMRMLAVVWGVFGVIAALTTSTALTARSPALQPAQIDVSPALRLIGLRSTQGSDSLDLQIFWQVKQSLQDEPIAWRLTDAAGKIWASREQLPRYGTGFAGAWAPNEIVEDHYDLPLDPAMPAGKYTLQVAYANPTFISVSELSIEPVKAAAPTAPPTLRRVDAQLGDRIRLIGFDAPVIGAPGQTILLTLYWQAERDIHEDLTVFVQLLDADGKLIAQHDGLTGDGFNPTMLWSPGRIVADRRSIVLPRDVPPGLYRLVAGMYRFATLERLPVTTPSGVSPDEQIELGALQVPMNVQSLQPSHTLVAALGSAIQLRGYDLATQDARGNVTAKDETTNPSRLKARSGQTLSLNLYWQAASHVDANYKVFVHVVDIQGNLVAQQDRIPGNGRYATPIWLPGERVLDQYGLLLALPPGEYRVMIGMYDANSGERLRVVQNGQELPNRQIEIGRLELAAQ